MIECSPMLQVYFVVSVYVFIGISFALVNPVKISGKQTKPIQAIRFIFALFWPATFVLMLVFVVATFTVVAILAPLGVIHVSKKR